MMQRRIVMAVLAAGMVAACSGRDPMANPDSDIELPLGAISVNRAGLAPPIELRILSYAGTYEMVEPDVVRIPGGFRGFEYWMAVNPYPSGDDHEENASVYASHDGIHWVTPDSLINPVFPRPSGDIRHNSDPDMVFVADPARLVLFDRSVSRSNNILRQSISHDGVHWTAPATILTVPNHELISPAVVLTPGHRPRLYAVNAGVAGCDSRTNTVTMRRWVKKQEGPDVLAGTGWSGPVTTDLRAPPGFVLWHLDVIWVADRKEYWAVFPAYGTTACAYNDLYAARSRDGLTWTTLETPLIARGSAPFIAGSVYRSSIVWDAASQTFQVWFSGLGDDSRWHLGYQQFSVESLAAQIDAQ
jgi:hypothetical protein